MVKWFSKCEAPMSEEDRARREGYRAPCQKKIMLVIVQGEGLGEGGESDPAIHGGSYEICRTHCGRMASYADSSQALMWFLQEPKLATCHCAHGIRVARRLGEVDEGV